MILKRIITIALVVIAANSYSQLTLEKIWNSREFTPKFVAGFKYLKDGVSYCQLDVNADKTFSYNKYNILTGSKISTIFSTEKLLVNGNQITVEGFEFNADESLVLITNGYEQMYRNSGKSNTYLFNIRNKKLTQISNKKIMYGTISPDGNKVAYVSDNNLFYFDIIKNKDVQITKDGEKNKIINGAVDWVYEEEFTMSKGFEWSNDGQYIAYYRFDETKVPEFSMDIYGSLYPKKETWKYPKAGEANSKVDVYIHKIGKKKSVKCETGSENDQYLPRIKWSNAGLIIQRLNRHQNKLDVLISNEKGNTAIFYNEENKYYVDVNDININPIKLKEGIGHEMIYLTEKKGYNQLWRFEKSNTYFPNTSTLGFKINTDWPITEGNWDIDQYLGTHNGFAYFTSGMNTPSERQLYSINLTTKELKQITTEAGWHSISFSPTYAYFVDNYSTLTNPSIVLIKDNNGQIIRTLEKNETLANKLASLNLGKVDFGSFTSSENVKLDYWRILPPNFDSNKKYPVLFFVYGGPGYQTVKNAWAGGNYLWYQYMASKGYIIITIDNRGSGARGEEFKKMTYLQLGKYETQDYIEAANYFGSQAYVAKDRIGVFGWSYGGFMASNCITKGAQYFKTAVAVAPVTNWRYYDNIYTERYMRTPQENADGYDKNSPINHVDSIKGKYLLIHGTADDNVHFQNAVEMVKAMNDKNIPYDAEYYPNKNHGIAGGKTRLHLFTKITTFLENNL